MPKIDIDAVPKSSSDCNYPPLPFDAEICVWAATWRQRLGLTLSG